MSWRVWLRMRDMLDRLIWQTCGGRERGQAEDGRQPQPSGGNSMKIGAGADGSWQGDVYSRQDFLG